MKQPPDLSVRQFCYACENEATSVEHTPPKCIFPQLKDFPHKNLRRNLITVPSCDRHNSAKSKDDANHCPRNNGRLRCVMDR